MLADEEEEGISVLDDDQAREDAKQGGGDSDDEQIEEKPENGVGEANGDRELRDDEIAELMEIDSD